ncbi:MAG: cysteine peptidase family C39 domain-containing protein, partial [Candidatus Omnitrophota bacterium]
MGSEEDNLDINRGNLKKPKSDDWQDLSQMKSLELNFADNDAGIVYQNQLDLGPYVQSNRSDVRFRSRFKSWMRAVSLVIILVFVPEQASWAFNYNPLVLWGDKSVYPSQTTSHIQGESSSDLVSNKISKSIKNLLDQIAYQENSRVKLELPKSSNKNNEIYSILLENNNNFNDSYISQITNWLTNPEIHPLNCGVYSLKDILKSYEFDIELEELSVTSLTVDLMSNIVKPGEKKLKTSLYSISKIVNAYGLNFKNAKLAPEDVVKLEPPFIASFKNEHFVTVTAIDDNKIYYNDIGLPVYLAKDVFISELSGFVLAKNLENKKDLEIEFIPDSMAAFVWGDKWRDQSDDLPGLVSSSEEWSGVITTLVIIVVTWGIGQALTAAAEAAKAANEMSKLAQLLAKLAELFSSSAGAFDSFASFAAAFNFSYGLSQFASAVATVCYMKGVCNENQAMLLNMAIAVGGSLFKGAALKVGGEQAAAGTAKSATLSATFGQIFSQVAQQLPAALAYSLTSMYVQKLVAEELSKMFIDDEDDSLGILEQAFVGIVSGAIGNFAGDIASTPFDYFMETGVGAGRQGGLEKNNGTNRNTNNTNGSSGGDTASGGAANAPAGTTNSGGFGQYFTDRLTASFSLQLDFIIDRLFGLAIKMAVIEAFDKLFNKKLEPDSLALMVLESVIRTTIAWGKEVLAENHAKAQLENDTRPLSNNPEEAKRQAQERYNEYLSTSKKMSFFSLLGFSWGIGGESATQTASASGESVLSERSTEASIANATRTEEERRSAITGTARANLISEVTNQASKDNMLGLSAILFSGLVRYFVATGLDRWEDSATTSDRAGINQLDRQKMAGIRFTGLLILGALDVGIGTAADAIISNRRGAIARELALANNPDLTSQQLDDIEQTAERSQYVDMGAVIASCKGKEASCISTEINNQYNSTYGGIWGDMAVRAIQEIGQPLFGALVAMGTLNGTDPTNMLQRDLYERGGADATMSDAEMTVRSRNALMGRWMQQADMAGIWGSPIRVAQFQRNRELTEKRMKERNQELIEMGYASEVKSDDDIHNQVITSLFNQINPLNNMSNYFYDTFNSYIGEYLIGGNSPGLRGVEELITMGGVLFGAYDATASDVNATLNTLRSSSVNIQNPTFVDAVLASNTVNILGENSAFTKSLNTLGIQARAPTRWSFALRDAAGVESRQTYLFGGHYGFEFDQNNPSETGVGYRADFIGFGQNGLNMVDRLGGGTLRFKMIQRFDPLVLSSVFGLTSETAGVWNGGRFTSMQDMYDGQYMFQRDDDGYLYRVNSTTGERVRIDQDGELALLTNQDTQIQALVDPAFISYMNANGVDVEISEGRLMNRRGEEFQFGALRTSTQGKTGNTPDNFILTNNKVVGSESEAFARSIVAYRNAISEGKSKDDALYLSQRAYRDALFEPGPPIGFRRAIGWDRNEAEQFAAGRLNLERLRRERDGEEFTIEQQREFVAQQYSARLAHNREIESRGDVYTVFGGARVRAPGSSQVVANLNNQLELFVSNNPVVNAQDGITLDASSLTKGISTAAFVTPKEGEEGAGVLKFIGTRRSDFLTLQQTIQIITNDNQETRKAIQGLIGQHYLIAGANPDGNNGVLVRNPESTGLKLERAEELAAAMGIDPAVSGRVNGMLSLARGAYANGISVNINYTASDREEIYSADGKRLLSSRANQFLTAPISFNIGRGGVDLGSSMTIITRDLAGNILYRAQAIRPAATMLAAGPIDENTRASLRALGINEAFLQGLTGGDGMIATQVILADAINPNDPTLSRNADGTINIEKVINGRAFYDVFILDKNGNQVLASGAPVTTSIRTSPADSDPNSVPETRESVLAAGTPLASRALFSEGIINPDKANQMGQARLGARNADGTLIQEPQLNPEDLGNSLFRLRYNPETDRVVRAGITQGFLGYDNSAAARSMFVTNSVYSTIAPFLRAPVTESNQNRSNEVKTEATIAQALRPDPAGEAAINGLVILGLRDRYDQAYVEPFDFYGESAFQQNYGIKIGMGSVIRTSNIVRDGNDQLVRRDPVFGKNPFQQVYYNPTTNALYQDDQGMPVYGQVEQGTVYIIRPVREGGSPDGQIIGAEMVQPNELNRGALALSLSGRASTRIGEGASAVREAGYVAVANRGRPFVYDGDRKEWITVDPTNRGEAYVISQQDVVVSDASQERRLASEVSAETMAGGGLTPRREAYLALFSGIRRDGPTGLMIFTPAERQNGQQNQILISDAMGAISARSIISETVNAGLTYHTLTGVVTAGSPGLERTIRPEDQVRNPEFIRRTARGESTEGVQEFITQAEAIKNELRASTQSTEAESEAEPQRDNQSGSEAATLNVPIDTDGTATITAASPGINLATGRFEMLLANNSLVPLTGNIKQGNLTVDPINGDVRMGRLFNSTSPEFNGRTETQGGTVWMTVNRRSIGGIDANGRFNMRSESQGDFYNVEQAVARAIAGTENATGFGADRPPALPEGAVPSNVGFGISELRIVGTRTIREGGLIRSARYFDGTIVASPEASMSMEAGEIVASRGNNTPDSRRDASGPVYYTALGQAVDFIRGRSGEEVSTFNLARVGDGNKLFIGASDGVQVIRDYLDPDKNKNPNAPNPPAEQRTTDSRDPGQTAVVESLDEGGGRGLVLLRAGRQASADAQTIKNNVLATDSDPRAEGDQFYQAGGVNTETALFYGITDQGMTFNEFMSNSNYFFKHEPNAAINRANQLIVSNSVSQVIANERGGGTAQVSQTNKLSTNAGGSIISMDARGNSRYYNFTNQWSMYADNVRIVGDLVDDGRLINFRDNGETLTSADGGFATYLNNPTGEVWSNYSRRGGIERAVTYITGRNNVYLYRDRTGKLRDALILQGGEVFVNASALPGANAQQNVVREDIRRSDNTKIGEVVVDRETGVIRVQMNDGRTYDINGRTASGQLDENVARTQAREVAARVRQDATADGRLEAGYRESSPDIFLDRGKENVIQTTRVRGEGETVLTKIILGSDGRLSLAIGSTQQDDPTIQPTPSDLPGRIFSRDENKEIVIRLDSTLRAEGSTGNVMQDFPLWGQDSTTIVDRNFEMKYYAGADSERGIPRAGVFPEFSQAKSITLSNAGGITDRAPVLLYGVTRRGTTEQVIYAFLGGETNVESILERNFENIYYGDDQATINRHTRMRGDLIQNLSFVKEGDEVHAVINSFGLEVNGRLINGALISTPQGRKFFPNYQAQRIRGIEVTDPDGTKRTVGGMTMYTLVRDNREGNPFNLPDVLYFNENGTSATREQFAAAFYSQSREFHTIVQSERYRQITESLLQDAQNELALEDERSALARTLSAKEDQVDSLNSQIRAIIRSGRHWTDYFANSGGGDMGMGVGPYDYVDIDQLAIDRLSPTDRQRLTQLKEQRAALQQEVASIHNFEGALQRAKNFFFARSTVFGNDDDLLFDGSMLGQSSEEQIGLARILTSSSDRDRYYSIRENAIDGISFTLDSGAINPAYVDAMRRVNREQMDLVLSKMSVDQMMQYGTPMLAVNDAVTWSELGGYTLIVGGAIFGIVSTFFDPSVAGSKVLAGGLIATGVAATSVIGADILKHGETGRHLTGGEIALYGVLGAITPLRFGFLGTVGTATTRYTTTAMLTAGTYTLARVGIQNAPNLARVVGFLELSAATSALATGLGASYNVMSGGWDNIGNNLGNWALVGASAPLSVLAVGRGLTMLGGGVKAGAAAEAGAATVAATPGLLTRAFTYVGGARGAAVASALTSTSARNLFVGARDFGLIAGLGNQAGYLGGVIASGKDFSGYEFIKSFAQGYGAGFAGALVVGGLGLGLLKTAAGQRFMNIYTLGLKETATFQDFLIAGRALNLQNTKILGISMTEATRRVIMTRALPGGVFNMARGAGADFARDGQHNNGIGATAGDFLVGAALGTVLGGRNLPGILSRGRLGTNMQALQMGGGQIFKLFGQEVAVKRGVGSLLGPRFALMGALGAHAETYYKIDKDGKPVEYGLTGYLLNAAAGYFVSSYFGGSSLAEAIGISMPKTEVVGSVNRMAAWAKGVNPQGLPLRDSLLLSSSTKQGLGKFFTNETLGGYIARQSALGSGSGALLGYGVGVSANLANGKSVSESLLSGNTLLYALGGGAIGGVMGAMRGGLQFARQQVLGELAKEQLSLRVLLDNPQLVRSVTMFGAADFALIMPAFAAMTVPVEGIITSSMGNDNKTMAQHFRGALNKLFLVDAQGREIGIFNSMLVHMLSGFDMGTDIALPLALGQKRLSSIAFARTTATGETKYVAGAFDTLMAHPYMHSQLATVAKLTSIHQITANMIRGNDLFIQSIQSSAPAAAEQALREENSRRRSRGYEELTGADAAQFKANAERNYVDQKVDEMASQVAFYSLPGFAAGGRGRTIPGLEEGPLAGGSGAGITPSTRRGPTGIGSGETGSVGSRTGFEADQLGLALTSGGRGVFEVTIQQAKDLHSRGNVEGADILEQALRFAPEKTTNVDQIMADSKGQAEQTSGTPLSRSQAEQLAAQNAEFNGWRSAQVSELREWRANNPTTNMASDSSTGASDGARSLTNSQVEMLVNTQIVRLEAQGGGRENWTETRQQLGQGTSPLSVREFRDSNGQLRVRITEGNAIEVYEYIDPLASSAESIGRSGLWYSQQGSGSNGRTRTVLIHNGEGSVRLHEISEMARTRQKDMMDLGKVVVSAEVADRLSTSTPHDFVENVLGYVGEAGQGRTIAEKASGLQPRAPDSPLKLPDILTPPITGPPTGILSTTLPFLMSRRGTSAETSTSRLRVGASDGLKDKQRTTEDELVGPLRNAMQKGRNQEQVNMDAALKDQLDYQLDLVERQVMSGEAGKGEIYSVAGATGSGKSSVSVPAIAAELKVRYEQLSQKLGRKLQAPFVLSVETDASQLRQNSEQTAIWAGRIRTGELLSGKEGPQLSVQRLELSRMTPEQIIEAIKTGDVGHITNIDLKTLLGTGYEKSFREAIAERGIDLHVGEDLAMAALSMSKEGGNAVKQKMAENFESTFERLQKDNIKLEAQATPIITESGDVIFIDLSSSKGETPQGRRVNLNLEHSPEAERIALDLAGEAKLIRNGRDITIEELRGMGQEGQLIIGMVQASIRSMVQIRTGEKRLPIHGKETMIVDSFGVGTEGVTERGILQVMADYMASQTAGKQSGRTPMQTTLKDVVNRAEGARVTDLKIYQTTRDSGGSVRLMSGTISEAKLNRLRIMFGAKDFGMETLNAAGRKPFSESEYTGFETNDPRQAIRQALQSRPNETGNVTVFDARMDRNALSSTPEAKFDEFSRIALEEAVATGKTGAIIFDATKKAFRVIDLSQGLKDTNLDPIKDTTREDGSIDSAVSKIEEMMVKENGLIIIADRSMMIGESLRATENDIVAIVADQGTANMFLKQGPDRFRGITDSKSPKLEERVQDSEGNMLQIEKQLLVLGNSRGQSFDAYKSRTESNQVEFDKQLLDRELLDFEQRVTEDYFDQIVEIDPSMKPALEAAKDRTLQANSIWQNQNIGKTGRLTAEVHTESLRHTVETLKAEFAKDGSLYARLSPEAREKIDRDIHSLESNELQITFAKDSVSADVSALVDVRTPRELVQTLNARVKLADLPEISNGFAQGQLRMSIAVKATGDQSSSNVLSSMLARRPEIIQTIALNSAGGPQLVSFANYNNSEAQHHGITLPAQSRFDARDNTVYSLPTRTSGGQSITTTNGTRVDVSTPSRATQAELATLQSNLANVRGLDNVDRIVLTNDAEVNVGVSVERDGQTIVYLPVALTKGKSGTPITIQSIPSAPKTPEPKTTSQSVQQLIQLSSERQITVEVTGSDQELSQTDLDILTSNLKKVSGSLEGVDRVVLSDRLNVSDSYSTVEDGKTTIYLARGYSNASAGRPIFIRGIEPTNSSQSNQTDSAVQQVVQLGANRSIPVLESPQKLTQGELATLAANLGHDPAFQSAANLVLFDSTQGLITNTYARRNDKGEVTYYANRRLANGRTGRPIQSAAITEPSKPQLALPAPEKPDTPTDQTSAGENNAPELAVISRDAKGNPQKILVADYSSNNIGAAFAVLNLVQIQQEEEEKAIAVVAMPQVKGKNKSEKVKPITLPIEDGQVKITSSSNDDFRVVFDKKDKRIAGVVINDAYVPNFGGNYVVTRESPLVLSQVSSGETAKTVRIEQNVEIHDFEVNTTGRVLEDTDYGLNAGDRIITINPGSQSFVQLVQARDSQPGKILDYITGGISVADSGDYKAAIVNGQYIDLDAPGSDLTIRLDDQGKTMLSKLGLSRFAKPNNKETVASNTDDVQFASISKQEFHSALIKSVAIQRYNQITQASHHGILKDNTIVEAAKLARVIVSDSDDVRVQETLITKEDEKGRPIAIRPGLKIFSTLEAKKAIEMADMAKVEAALKEVGINDEDVAIVKNEIARLRNNPGAVYQVDQFAAHAPQLFGLLNKADVTTGLKNLVTPAVSNDRDLALSALETMDDEGIEKALLDTGFLPETRQVLKAELKKVQQDPSILQNSQQLTAQAPILSQNIDRIAYRLANETNANSERTLMQALKAIEVVDASIVESILNSGAGQQGQTQALQFEAQELRTTPSIGLQKMTLEQRAPQLAALLDEGRSDFAKRLAAVVEIKEENPQSFGNVLRTWQRNYDLNIQFDPLLDLGGGQGAETIVETDTISLGMSALVNMLPYYSTGMGAGIPKHEFFHLKDNQGNRKGADSAMFATRFHNLGGMLLVGLNPKDYGAKGKSFTMAEQVTHRIESFLKGLGARSAYEEGSVSEAKERSLLAADIAARGSSFGYTAKANIEYALAIMKNGTISAQNNTGRIYTNNNQSVEVQYDEMKHVVSFVVTDLQQGLNYKIEQHIPSAAEMSEAEKGMKTAKGEFDFEQIAISRLNSSMVRSAQESALLDTRAKAMTQMTEDPLVYQIANNRGKRLQRSLDIAVKKGGNFKGIDVTADNAVRVVSEIISTGDVVRTDNADNITVEYVNPNTGRGMVVDKTTGQIKEFISKGGSKLAKNERAVIQDGRTKADVQLAKRVAVPIKAVQAENQALAKTADASILGVAARAAALKLGIKASVEGADLDISSEKKEGLARLKSSNSRTKAMILALVVTSALQAFNPSDAKATATNMFNEANVSHVASLQQAAPDLEDYKLVYSPSYVSAGKGLSGKPQTQEVVQGSELTEQNFVPVFEMVADDSGYRLAMVKPADSATQAFVTELVRSNLQPIRLSAGPNPPPDPDEENNASNQIAPIAEKRKRNSSSFSGNLNDRDTTTNLSGETRRAETSKRFSDSLKDVDNRSVRLSNLSGMEGSSPYYGLLEPQMPTFSIRSPVSSIVSTPLMLNAGNILNTNLSTSVNFDNQDVNGLINFDGRPIQLSGISSVEASSVLNNVSSNMRNNITSITQDNRLTAPTFIANQNELRLPQSFVLDATLSQKPMDISTVQSLALLPVRTAESNILGLPSLQTADSAFLASSGAVNITSVTNIDITSLAMFPNMGLLGDQYNSSNNNDIQGSSYLVELKPATISVNQEFAKLKGIKSLKAKTLRAPPRSKITTSTDAESNLLVTPELQDQSTVPVSLPTLNVPTSAPVLTAPSIVAFPLLSSNKTTTVMPSVTAKDFELAAGRTQTAGISAIGDQDPVTMINRTIQISEKNGVKPLVIAGNDQSFDTMVQEMVNQRRPVYEAIERNGRLMIVKADTGSREEVKIEEIAEKGVIIARENVRMNENDPQVKEFVKAIGLSQDNVERQGQILTGLKGVGQFNRTPTTTPTIVNFALATLNKNNDAATQVNEVELSTPAAGISQMKISNAQPVENTQVMSGEVAKLG